MSKFNNFVRSPEHWNNKIREERRKTVQLLAWILFWVTLFVLLHALT